MKLQKLTNFRIQFPPLILNGYSRIKFPGSTFVIMRFKQGESFYYYAVTGHVTKINADNKNLNLLTQILL